MGTSWINTLVNRDKNKNSLAQGALMSIPIFKKRATEKKKPKGANRNEPFNQHVLAKVRIRKTITSELVSKITTDNISISKK